jgi:hypothetical protein
MPVGNPIPTGKKFFRLPTRTAERFALNALCSRQQWQTARVLPPTASSVSNAKRAHRDFIRLSAVNAFESARGALIFNLRSVRFQILNVREKSVLIWSIP